MSGTYFQILIVCGFIIIFNDCVLFYFATVCFVSSQQEHEAGSIFVYRHVCVCIHLCTCIYIYAYVCLYLLTHAGINYIFPLELFPLSILSKIPGRDPLKTMVLCST